MALLFLAASTLACAGSDPSSPTASSLQSLTNGASVSSSKPDHAGGGKGGDGGGGKTDPTVTLAGAMATASAQPLSHHKDNKRELAAGGDIDSSLAFDSTYAAYGADPSGCAVTPSDTPVSRQRQLLEHLTDPTGIRGLWMTVDKTSLGSPSEDQGISLHHHDSSIGVGVGSQKLLPSAGPATVTEQPDGTYTYSGGAVQVSDQSGQELEHVSIACPNLDQVVATVTG